MRVLMISKACIVGIYQRKLEALARLGIELLVLVPPAWRDERGITPLERVYTEGYRLETVPIRFNGNFHLHYYPTLGQHMRAFRPHIVHIDEEPYNLSAWQALFEARRVGAKSLFFTWQNILRHYPPPFAWGERWMLNTVDYAIAGTESAAQIWREKGYTKPIAVIPQFGTDPNLFTPVPRQSNRPFTIGYFGRLVAEKGIDTLLRAAASLQFDWRLMLIGGGPEREGLAQLAHHLGIAGCVEFREQIPSTQMPAQYQGLDAFVLPSLTRPNWKEQFGRVLVEAMASGVPVIGSDSGAIPDVIGGAGLIFPEGDSAALAERITRLHEDRALAESLAKQGIAHVRAHFTHEQVAADTFAVYQAMVG